ncbi:Hemin-binding periplasmic protein HmuT precursor [Methyloligella halotolerans]|uniref:Hemin-binding periplasmic protein HmuT n=1 Tax=Methyloligella halotolerans TaxID=1177755 RepID=A0A1E2S161_9HYPH|nr:ABC transporter substrate-binding protein [Methyloligella halotolerans]ODA68194.1 Hemin-binding periplasmic protein HmuT precursor [Methyloligella halotolerans]
MTASTLRVSIGAALLLIMLALGAWWVQAAPSFAVAVTDAAGDQIEVEDLSRIVSIGGDVTEILYALDKDDQIIAVDTTSQYPATALEEKEEVGYMRALSAEGVLSMNPSVIIASAGSGPPEVVKLLKSSSVPYVEVPDDTSPEAVADKVRFVAKVVGEEEAGEKIAKGVEDDFALLAEQREKIDTPKRVLFILSVSDGKASVAGAGTGADAIIKLAGGENAAGMVTGYKPVVNESAIELAPDAIVTMAHGGPGSNSLEMIKSVKGMEMTPAVKNNRVISMDGLYLLGFGPRASKAARDLMAKLYPELEIPHEDGGDGAHHEAGVKNPHADR